MADNQELLSLAGLESLTHVTGDVRISQNELLLSLAGLHRLTAVDDHLNVQYNDGLTTLEGLDALRFAGFVEVYDCAHLVSLDGLEQLREIGRDLKTGERLLGGNDELRSVTALYGLETVQDDVWIVDNERLTDEAAWALVAEIDDISGDIEIDQNQP